MNKLKLTLSALAVFALVLVCSSVSLAQTKRVWVKSNGVDLGNLTCGFASPCRTFQKAVNNSVGGQPEVDAIDTADYSNARSDDPAISASTTLSITHAVTIDGTGSLATLSGGDLLAAPTNGISIVLASQLEVVTLRALVISGGHLGGSGGVPTTGVSFTGNGSLVMEHCTVINWGRYGIDFEPTGPSNFVAGDLYVRDSELTNNEQAGCFIQNNSAAPATSARASLDNTRFSNNGAFGSGLGLWANSRTKVNVSDSLFATNGLNGILAQPTAGGGSNTAEVNATNCFFNGNFVGVAALNSGADTSLIRIASDDIFDNGAAIGLGIGCTISSFGTNRMAGNSSNNGPPNNFIPLQ